MCDRQIAHCLESQTARFRQSGRGMACDQAVTLLRIGCCQSKIVGTAQSKSPKAKGRVPFVCGVWGCVWLVFRPATHTTHENTRPPAFSQSSEKTTALGSPPRAFCRHSLVCIPIASVHEQTPNVYPPGRQPWAVVPWQPVHTQRKAQRRICALGPSQKGELYGYTEQ